MARWSVTEVVGLAPDARSVSAARSLARPGRWSELGCTDSLVWGRCQGSGKEPYQVTVDLTEPAFRCTCPSRKFPCKHGLALLLLWVEGDGSVADAEVATGFADEWRPGRAPRGSAAPAGRTTTAPDPEARAARIASRLALMDAGLDDHERWLADLVRQGLGTARSLPYASWDGAAARLVDAQVPRLAERVRALGGAVHARTDWPDHLLAELGRCQLASRAWRRRDELPGDAASDVRAVLGWPVPSEEVRGRPPLADTWHVVGVRRAGDDRVQSQRTWLRGTTTGTVVVLLDFAAAAGTLEVAHVLGALVEGEVVQYPGSAPRRAILLDGHRVVGSRDLGADGADGGPLGDVAAALDEVAAALAADPFLERVPVWLGGVVVARDDAGAAVAVDAADRALPLHPAIDVGALLALTGARPFDLMGEWDDGWLVPLSASIDGALTAVPVDDGAPVPVSAVSARSEHWSALVSSALVGTDRRAVPPPDPDVAAALTLPDDLDAAARLLLDAAVEDARRRAGSEAALVHRRLEPAPDDPAAEAPAAAVQLLELVLGGAAGLTTGRDPVLVEWFEACVAAGRRAPHRLVTTLLDLAARDERWRPAVASVVGERGRWLAADVPAWSWAAIAATSGGDSAASWAAVWAEGSSSARRRALAAWRPTDPDGARELLASTWSTETAADRAAFVELLATGVSDADEAFLDAALSDRATSVRSRAAHVLDHLPGSRRAERLARRLGPLVSRSGDGRGALAVALPDEPGREAAADLPGGAPPRGLGARAWQLAQIVAGVPLDRWVEWADPDPRRTIELADARAELVSGWTRAAVAQRRPDWAAALLVHRPVPELVGALDPDDRAGAASWLLGTADPAAVAGLLAAVSGPWPRSLTERLLTWFDGAKVPPPSGVAVAELVAARAAPADAPVVDGWLADRREQDLARRALRAAHHALTLRAAVRDAFDPPLPALELP